MSEWNQKAINTANSPSYKEWVAQLAANMPETPKQKLSRQREGWLTQEKIDKMDPIRPESKFRRIWTWLNGEPEGAFTLFVLVMFVLGLWAAVALWRLRW